MTVTPVTTTRVSQSMQANVLKRGMRQSLSRLLHQQEQLSTGRRILRPSDNPIDATATIRMDDLLEAQQQYLTNIDYASKTINVSYDAIGSIQLLVREADGLAIENINNPTVSGQREAAAALVDSMIDQLMTLGNSEYLGRHLFAGTRSDSPPYQRQAGLVAFAGDQGEATVRVSAGVSERINLKAVEVFGSGSGRVISDHDLMPAAETDTRLKDIAGSLGQGIRTGTLVIVGSVIGQVDIDLTGSATLGDVINKANDALPSTVQLSLEPDGRHLRVTSINAGETLQVLEAGQGTIGHDLGLYTPTPASGTIVGGDFSPEMIPQTAVGALAQNAGIDLTSGIIISNGIDSITIDFSSATTVQDILSTINAAGVGLRASINEAGTGIEIVNTLAGAAVRIAENGGTTAADLGIQTFKSDTRLADLNDGLAVQTVTGTDMVINTRDLSQINVDLSGTETIQDVLDRINTAAAGAITASLSGTGNGIILTDNTVGAGTLSVVRPTDTYSNAAEDLGLLKEDLAGSGQIVGDDVNGIKEESLFTYLLDFRNALLADDNRGIQLAGAKIEAYQEDLTRYYGKLGFMARGLETRSLRTEDAVLSTKALLSEIKDLDFTEAITDFQNLQTILQANLMAGGQILNISLLNYLR